MSQEQQKRLSDHIVSALELAVEQEDADVAELLCSALELSVTRQAGGSGFVERRSFPDEIRDLMDRASDLKR